MSILEEKANLVLASASQDSDGELKEVFVDPATIFAIIGVISQVIKLYQGCRKTPEAAQVSMSDPSWWNKWKLRRVARQTLREKGIKDVATDRVVEGVLEQGKNLTVDEVHQMYTEVK
jgi:hypothetical protein